MLAAVQLACNFPVAGGGTGNIDGTATATLPPIQTFTPGAPAVITATPGQAATQPAQPAAPTATTASNGGTGQQTGGCTYLATFISDVTIPDDSVIEAGKTFVKTWRVRNDGTCTWGPSGYPLHALAFTGGSKLGAPDQVPLPKTVAPGEQVDLSVSMTAPTTAGTYTSQWGFRVDNDPNGVGPYIGVGPKQDGALYVRIRVGSSASGATQSRLSFDAGATSTSVDGELKAGEKRGFVLAAMKGQILMAALNPAADARLQITAADKANLSGTTSSDGQNAQVTLPSSQDYTVWVTGGSQKSSYTLDIIIPSRLTFDQGETSTSVDGKATRHRQVIYALRAQAGQTLTVSLTGSNVGLTIYGLQDGQPLVRAEGEATSFNGKLPATQDYILVVVPAVDTVSFTMKVTLK